MRDGLKIHHADQRMLGFRKAPKLVVFAYVLKLMNFHACHILTELLLYKRNRKIFRKIFKLHFAHYQRFVPVIILG